MLDSSTGKLIKYISWVFVVICIYYCIFRIVHDYASIPIIKYNFITLIHVFLMFISLLCAFIFLSEGWRHILAMCGVYLSVFKAYSIMGISQIGKYAPGNVFQYVGRVGIGGRHGVSSYVLLSASIWLETLMLILVSSAIVIYGLLIDSNTIPVNAIYQGKHIMSFGIILLSLLVLTVIAMRYFRNRLDNYRIALRYKDLFLSSCYYFIFIVLSGCVVSFIPIILWGDSGSLKLFGVIWKFALCWLAGFIVPGAPAGLGVREAMFTKLFAPELGEGGAACVALVFRVLTTIGDLVTFGLAWLVGKCVLSKAALNAQEIP